MSTSPRHPRTSALSWSPAAGDNRTTPRPASSRYTGEGLAGDGQVKGEWEKDGMKDEVKDEEVKDEGRGRMKSEGWAVFLLVYIDLLLSFS